MCKRPATEGLTFYQLIRKASELQYALIGKHKTCLKLAVGAKTHDHFFFFLSSEILPAKNFPPVRS